MALEEYVGSIVLEIDGQEIDIESLDDSIKTGRKIVKTMNSTACLSACTELIWVSIPRNAWRVSRYTARRAFSNRSSAAACSCVAWRVFETTPPPAYSGNGHRCSLCSCTLF